MADKRKQPKKGSAAATRAANKTAARARTEKAGEQKSGSPRVSSQPRKKADELVRLGEALRPSEAIYQQIVDTMEDSLTVLDAEGTFLFANTKAALNLSGGAPSSVVGKNISRFVPKAQAEQLIDKYRRVITTGRPLEQEVMVTLQGVDRWFLNSLRPVSFGVHNIPALVSSSRDITDRNRVEEALRESQKFLETIIDAAPS